MAKDKMDLILELMEKWFEAQNEKFKSIDERFKSIDEKFSALNTKIDWIHDDIRDLKEADKNIIAQNRKIEEELVKPLQRKTAIKHIEFTSVWWMVSFMIAVVASLFSYWIAKAFW